MRRLASTRYQRYSLLGCAQIVLSAVLVALSQAQMTLDGSLGARPTLSGPHYVITARLGQRQGPNLFHSFARFNILAGESVTFTGPATIDHIIARVTGGERSLLNGVLRSDIRGAHVFLLNPHGVLFGPQARLEVSGAFHASTADYLRLDQGKRFVAALSKASVLSTAPPEAFGFLGRQQPAPLTVRASSLTVPTGKTLSLIGGDLAIQGGVLSAPSGRIHLASMATAGEVRQGLAEPHLSVSPTATLGRIGLTQDALVNASGNGGGTVVIRSGHLLIDNADVFVDTHDKRQGAPLGIDIHVTGGVHLTRESLVSTDVFQSGSAGMIRLHAQRLRIRDGASLRSLTFQDSSGNAGDIAITAHSVHMTTGGTVASVTGSGSRGRAGTVSLHVQTLDLSARAQISSSTFGHGHGGIIRVVAEEHLRVTGRPDRTTGLFSDTSSTGKAGAIIIRAGQVEMGREGIIGVGAFARGNAGTIRITAEQVTVTAGALIDSSSFARGDGGTLQITTTRLAMQDGAIQARAFATGKAGDITLQTQDLQLSQGAMISTQSTGPKNAGTIHITSSGQVWLREQSAITTEATRASGGNLVMRGPSLLRLQNSTISTSVMGGREAVGGDITLDARFVVVEHSQITANAVTGQGGRITIRSQVYLSDFASQVTASAGPPGIDGRVDVQAAVTDVSASTPSLSHTFLSPLPLLSSRCAVRLHEGIVSRFVIRGRPGIPAAPPGILPSRLYDSQPAGLTLQASAAPAEWLAVDSQGEWRIHHWPALAPAWLAFACDHPALAR